MRLGMLCKKMRASGKIHEGETLYNLQYYMNDNEQNPLAANTLWRARAQRG